MAKFATMVTSMRLEGGEGSVREYLEALTVELHTQADGWSQQANNASTKRGAARDSGESEGWRGAARMVEAIIRGLPAETVADRRLSVLTEVYRHVSSMLPDRLDVLNRDLHAKAMAALRESDVR